MAAPLISVIMPTYNYGHLIGEALESLIAQTCTNWECIVVDDASTDATLDVLTQYSEVDSRIRFWSQGRTGPVTARNSALAEARGKYIQFLDADDLLEERKLELHSGLLDEHPEVHVVYGEVRYFSESSTENLRYSMFAADKDWMPRVSGQGEDVLRELVRLNIMSFNAALFRSSAMNEVGRFDDGDVTPVADWDYLVRCAVLGQRFEFRDWPQTMTLMRWHPGSMSSDKRYMLRATLRLREKLDWLMDDGKILAENRRLYAREEGDLGVEEVICGRRAAGMYHLLRAARFSRGLKARQSWIARAALAPLVPRERFAMVAKGSITSQLRGWRPRQTLS